MGFQKNVPSVYAMLKNLHIMTARCDIQKLSIGLPEKIIMLSKPMVTKENKVTAPNSIMKLEACT